MTSPARRFRRHPAVTALLTPLLVAAVAHAGAPGPGDCCSPNSVPGCNEPTCETAVCAQDLFCCTVQWDQLCALAAAQLCECDLPSDICGVSTNDCFVPGTGPGCSDTECCLFLCAFDIQCCSVEWDEACASNATLFCDNGPDDPPPPAGCGIAENDCFTTGTVAGCSDAACCEAVCATDLFCCTTEWDLLCVTGALTICEPGETLPSCLEATGPCTIASNTPGCSDTECCQSVCSTDPVCCVIGWDTGCVLVALEVCGLAPSCGTSANDCFLPGTGSGCSDEFCCQSVCSFAPSCCEIEWDQFCATAALSICEGAPVDPSGCGVSTNTCFTTSPLPGCADEACCLAICAFDAFCCNVQWDFLCVQSAEAECDGSGEQAPSVCGTATNDCFEIGGPGCSSTACCQFVCLQDPLCCLVAWDALCVIAAEEFCVPTEQVESICGAATHGCADLGGPGCADADCCAMVCEVAPDCCMVAWDATCIDLAERSCEAPITGDLNADGTVNGADLGILLASWGPCSGCSADLNGNGEVDSADLGVLLAAWSQ